MTRIDLQTVTLAVPENVSVVASGHAREDMQRDTVDHIVDIPSATPELELIESVDLHIGAHPCGGSAASAGRAVVPVGADSRSAALVVDNGVFRWHRHSPPELLLS